MHGVQLKSYEFEKYKTKKTEKIFDIKISFKTNLFKLNTNKRFNSLLKGISLTKDLVSEPGNILHPDEYAKRITQLRKIGLKINVYDKKKLKKLLL